MNSFLAILAEGGTAAQVFACRGTEARRALQEASDGSGVLTLPAPEGAGLHVWEGRIQGDDLDGQWRRATAVDLEGFGMPLSEAAEEAASAVLEEGEAIWDGAAVVSPADLRAAKQAITEATGVEPNVAIVGKPEGFCCKMREKFVVGIVATNEDVPMPVDLADHVLHWGKKIIFASSYCPFCGTKIDRSQTLRVDPDAV